MYIFNASSIFAVEFGFSGIYRLVGFNLFYLHV